MAGPFNITSFNAEISKTGIAQNSFFMAMISATPTGLSGKFGFTNGLSFRIESVNLPGRTLTTLDQNYHGPVRRIPYRFTHQPITFSVILSRDMREREFFMQWQDYFVGRSRTSGGTGLAERPFDSRYYDTGIGEMVITQYSYPIQSSSSTAAPSQEYVESYNITCQEAYPSSVQDIQLGWGEEGYGKLQVEMTYRFATEKHLTFGDNRQLAAEKAVQQANP